MVDDFKGREELDLDALTQQPGRIKLNGEYLEIMPPTLGELIVLTKLRKKLTESQGDPVAALELFEESRVEIEKIIPELEGKLRDISQIMGVIQFMDALATPKDLEELAKRKITPLNDDQKKALDSIGLGKSEDSVTSTQDILIPQS